MLSIGSDLRAAINLTDAVFVALVSIEWENDFGGPVRMTDAPHSVTLDGLTYEPIGALISVTPPQANGLIDRDLFSIRLSDPYFVFKENLEQESTGVPVSIKVAAYVNNRIVTESLSVYEGFLSTAEVNIEGDADAPEPVTTLTCVGPFAKLYQITGRTTSPNNQKERHPNDTAFDRSFDVENEATLRWGGNGGA